MQTAIFYGASDDLIEIEGVKGADEFGPSTDRQPYMASFNLSGKMRVHVIYDGCWSFAIGLVNEGIPLPDWPVRITQHDDPFYSMHLEIDVPDDIVLIHERDE